MKRAALLALAGVLLLAVGPGGAAERTAPLRVGDTAPDVVPGVEHGRTFRLSEGLRARDVVVLASCVKAFPGG